MATKTIVTGTVVDQSGQVWANGTASVRLHSGGHSGPFYWNDAPLDPAYLQITQIPLDAEGKFTFELPATKDIYPPNTSWYYTICPDATSACVSFRKDAEGATQDISVELTSVLLPLVVQPGLLPAAYSDPEIGTYTDFGAVYINSISGKIRYYNGTAWVDLAAGDVDSASGPFLPLDGSQSMTGWINFSSDQSGLVFYGSGRIYKENGGGMILRKSSGNQQWKIQNNDGGGAVAIATLNDIPAPVDAYTKIESDDKYALKTEIVPPVVATTIGDIKIGVQPTDHSGWVILNGRATSTFAATQQTAAASLGFTANLPDFSSLVPMQNGTTLGSVAGSMELTLTPDNIPSFSATTSSDGDHAHSVMAVTNDQGDTGFSEMLPQGAYPAQKVWNRQAITATGNNGNLAIVGTPMDGSGPHSHTITLGGSATPIDKTPKSASVNYFLYLGV